MFVKKHNIITLNSRDSNETFNGNWLIIWMEYLQIKSRKDSKILARLDFPGSKPIKFVHIGHANFTHVCHVPEPGPT